MFGQPYPQSTGDAPHSMTNRGTHPAKHAEGEAMEEKTLRSLGEADSEARKCYIMDWNKPRLNGIACPECGAELMDTSPGQVLASLPPRTAIHCSECNYTGSRIV